MSNYCAECERLARELEAERDTLKARLKELAGHLSKANPYQEREVETDDGIRQRLMVCRFCDRAAGVHAQDCPWGMALKQAEEAGVDKLHTITAAGGKE